MSHSDVDIGHPGDLRLDDGGHGARNVAPSDTTDDRNEDQKKKDAETAERLSALIEDANSRVVPLCKMVSNNSAHPSRSN